MARRQTRRRACRPRAEARRRLTERGPPGPHHHERTWRSALQSGFVAAGALEALVAFLRFDRERSDRPGFEALQRDRLARLLAESVGAFIDRLPRQGGVGNELAEAIAGPQFERAIGFGGGAIGEIGLRQALFLHVLQSLV